MLFYSYPVMTYMKKFFKKPRWHSCLRKGDVSCYSLKELYSQNIVYKKQFVYLEYAHEYSLQK